MFFLCSQMTCPDSPAIENRVCTVQVYHFTHFCHSRKSNCSSGPSGARGPRFIEAPEPPVSTSLVNSLVDIEVCSSTWSSVDVFMRLT